jgi:hypothetical protein
MRSPLPPSICASPCSDLYSMLTALILTRIYGPASPWMHETILWDFGGTGQVLLGVPWSMLGVAQPSPNFAARAITSAWEQNLYPDSKLTSRSMPQYPQTSQSFRSSPHVTWARWPGVEPHPNDTQSQSTLPGPVVIYKAS